MKGYAAIISALVFCPCHLPILAAVFAGTALGTMITENFGLLFPLMAVYFMGALALGVRWLTQRETPACCGESAPASSRAGGLSELQSLEWREASLDPQAKIPSATGPVAGRRGRGKLDNGPA